MSEAKKESAPKQPAEKKGKAAAASLPGEKKVEKKVWTLAKCMKTANRFSTENEWSAGCPAAYKSAVAHGWVAQCTAGMKKTNAVRKSA